MKKEIVKHKKQRDMKVHELAAHVGVTVVGSAFNLVIAIAAIPSANVLAIVLAALSLGAAYAGHFASLAQIMTRKLNRVIAVSSIALAIGALVALIV